MNVLFHARDLPGADVPVLDRQYMSQLGEELESVPRALAFLSSYLQLLPARLASISSAVRAGDADTGMDRAISLKVTSAMVGALQLAAYAEVLETLVGRGDWGAAELLLDVLERAAAGVQTASKGVLHNICRD